MNMEIGTEAAQYQEKEYINGIFLAVYLNVASIYPIFCAIYPLRSRLQNSEFADETSFMTLNLQL
jgi:hypothetical protein